MGGCCSVSLSCDQFVNQVTQCQSVQASYIPNIEKNLTVLETTMEELKAKRNDLSRRVEREENRGLRRLDEIENWLSRVETIESQVSSLLSIKTNELQRLCLCGFCSKSIKLSYHYGKHVSMKLEEVENLKSKGCLFDVVAEQVQAVEVVERPIQQKIVGQEAVLETAWKSLTKDEVGIFGLYGMGGVGKTTLLEQINNKFKGSAFIVIWTVVSKDLQIQKIQEEIAKKLGLDWENWNHKSEDQKACDIHNILKKKKFVLLLDDIWEKVDLKKMGIPFPDRENESKVVFTTRSQEVSRRMGVDDQMEVQCLSPEDALDLFQKKVGEVTLGSHPDIPELAEVVAKKCRGLPLALNVIGEAMSYKQTVREWYHAIDILKSNAAEFSEVEDEILPILKYSYDNLKSRQIKSCLLYCALFPEDHRISKDELTEKWICEGIIDDCKGMHRAHDKGSEIIWNLVRSSLLMEGETEDEVHMHDVVREMALWIASDFGKEKDNFVVHAGAGLCEMPKLKNWNVVKRMSLMANKIDHICGSLECIHLTTLFLQKNEKALGNISGEFFKSMSRVVVLDLSFNDISELPDEISELVSLKYLNMQSTALQCLPVGLQELKNLIFLDLTSTHQLSSIVGISALLKLKVLKILGAGVAYSSKTKEELIVLEHLEILTISINSGLDDFLSSHKLMSCTQALLIKGCQLEASDLWRLAQMKKIHGLHLEKCTISKIKMDIGGITRETVSLLQNPKPTLFVSLSKISLFFCKCPKELTWLMLAPNLTWLFVHGGIQVEEIINKEKASESEVSSIVPFQKLQYLKLSNLPKLKNIYWKPLPFSCLKKLHVDSCPKLGKLPLNSKSSSSGEKGLIIEYYQREWFEGVEWEDEATKARFLPSSSRLYE